MNITSQHDDTNSTQCQAENLENQECCVPTTSLQNTNNVPSDDQSLLEWEDSLSLDRESNDVQPQNKFMNKVTSSSNVNIKNTSHNIYHGSVTMNQYIYQTENCDGNNVVPISDTINRAFCQKKQNIFCKLFAVLSFDKWCSLRCYTAFSATMLMVFSIILTIVLHLRSIQPSPAPDNELKIVTRQEWGAKPIKPIDPDLLKFKIIPPEYIIANETETDYCETESKCIEIVRSIQLIHLNANFNDIGFNFLIGGDGRIYEGRGWNHPGISKYSGIYDYDSMSIGVSFIGSFETDIPTKAQLEAALKLFEFGVENKKISHDYKLRAVREIFWFCENPGKMLFDIIKKWEKR